MKITAIIESESHPPTLAFKTDPPLTKEVFDAMRGIVEDLAAVPESEFKNGLLVVQRPERDTIMFLNQLLPEAEIRVSEEKANAEAQRKAYLQHWSDQFKLPLE